MRHVDHPVQARHHPVLHEWLADPVRVVGLVEPLHPGGVPLDQLLFRPLTGGFRLAATDPLLSGPGRAVDAMRSSSEVIAALLAGDHPEEAMREANRWLHIEGLIRLDGQRSCAAAVADWDPWTGRLRAVQAADVDIWVHEPQGWRSLFPGDVLEPAARAAWRTGAAPQSEREAHLRSHDLILGNREAWSSAPLGSFSDPVLRNCETENVDAVVVTSDGFELRQHHLETLGEGFRDGSHLKGWLLAHHKTLHRRSEHWPHPSPHGDIAVLVAYSEVP